MLDKIVDWFANVDKREEGWLATDSSGMIRITRNDIDTLVPSPINLSASLQITLDDIDNVETDILAVTLDDLGKINEQVLRLAPKDIPPLPPLFRIRLADLPADLTNVVTCCYHGTSLDSAKKIQRQGFCVGSGMAMGAGIYFSVGGITLARSYATNKSKPCIVRTEVDWGKVAYLDDPKIPNSFKSGSGSTRTTAAMRKGYHSFIQISKYSKEKPTVGVVLGKKGAFIKPPRIVVADLLNPRTGKPF